MRDFVPLLVLKLESITGGMFTFFSFQAYSSKWKFEVYGWSELSWIQEVPTRKESHGNMTELGPTLFEPMGFSPPLSRDSSSLVWGIRLFLRPRNKLVSSCWIDFVSRWGVSCSKVWSVSWMTQGKYRELRCKSLEVTRVGWFQSGGPTGPQATRTHPLSSCWTIAHFLSS